MMYYQLPHSRCRMGFSYGDMTPPVGIYHRMWGAAVHDRAEGVHRPLRASVLALEPSDGSAGDRQLLVALDLCLLQQRERDEIVEAVAERTGWDAGTVAVVCSHTHAAGLLTYDRCDQPGGELIPPFLNGLRTRVADLAFEAIKRLDEVWMAYGTGRCSLAAERDLWDESRGEWVCGFHPQGAADDTLMVVSAATMDGRRQLTVVNYACHPTTLAWDNRLISPDYPGAMREMVERETGAPCLFLQGAAGDLGPREGFVGDVAVADRNGRQLAYAALAMLEQMPLPGTRWEYRGPVVSGATIGTWGPSPLPESGCAAWSSDRRACPIKYRADLAGLQETVAELEELVQREQLEEDEELRSQWRALAERKRRLVARLRSLPAGDSYPLRSTVWRMGGAVWVLAQGEPYQHLQLELRRRFAQQAVVVATLAETWGPAYLPPADRYGRGIYQEQVAVLERGCLEQLIEHVSDQIGRCLAGDSLNPVPTTNERE